MTITYSRELVKSLSDALLKVRPLGGSELFKRYGDEFFADPKYCGDEIDKMKNDLHECRKRIATLDKLRRNDKVALTHVVEILRVIDDYCLDEKQFPKTKKDLQSILSLLKALVESD